MANQHYCSVCETWMEFDDDGNTSPCGAFECPYGVLREEDDPQELDFNEFYGTGEDGDELFQEEIGGD